MEVLSLSLSLFSEAGGSAEKRRDLENLVRSELNQLDGGQ